MINGGCLKGQEWPNLPNDPYIKVHRSSNDSWLGGVLGGLAVSLGVSSAVLRIIFLILFLGVGGLTFGISSGAVVFIYVLCWMILPKR